MNRTEQNRTEQNRTEQNRTEHSSLKGLWVYGAGARAKLYADYAAQRLKRHVSGFIVSDGQNEPEVCETFGGERLQVLSFGAFKREHRDASAISIVNTVNSLGAVGLVDDIDSWLAAAGSAPCFDLTSSDHLDDQLDMIQYLFAELGVSVSDKILHFKDVAIYNPIAIDKKLAGDLLASLGDIIIPPVFDDHRLTWSGPYEHGAVSLAPGENVVDAGANLGIFTCLAAARGCRVTAFEPDESALEVLEQQRELYPDRITIVPKGLSDKKQMLTFHISADPHHSSFIFDRSTISERTIQCETLDGLVESGELAPPDFIKAGAAGSEPLILAGAADVLRKCAPKIASAALRGAEEVEAPIRAADPSYRFARVKRRLFAWKAQGRP